MNRITGLLLPLLLASGLLRAQSKEETMQYILDEFKSLESLDYTVRNIAFSASGDSFSFTRQHRGGSEQGCVVPLAKVDIYAVTVHRANGVDYMNLLVRARGKEGDFMENGLRRMGTMALVVHIEDERKVKSLAKAFNHLIHLVTGRKDLFHVP